MEALSRTRIFPIWGPHGERIQRALMHQGLHIGPDGTLQRAEFRGPGSYDAWLACFKTYAATLIMLNAVSPPVIGYYQEFIEEQVKLYGADCWTVIYQADVRMRRDFLEVIRREESEKLDVAQAANGTYPFDPEFPWRRCYELAPSASEFGRRT